MSKSRKAQRNRVVLFYFILTFDNVNRAENVGKKL